MSRLTVSDNVCVKPVTPYKDKLELCGEVTLTVNGKEYKSRNTISSTLKANLSSAMVFTESYNLRDTELFNESNIPPVGTDFFVNNGRIEILSTDFGAIKPKKSISPIFVLSPVDVPVTVTVNTINHLSQESFFVFDILPFMSLQQIRDEILSAFPQSGLDAYYEIIDFAFNEENEQMGFFLQALAFGDTYDGADMTSVYDGWQSNGPTADGEIGDTNRSITINLQPQGQSVESFPITVLDSDTPSNLAAKIYDEIEIYVLTSGYTIERVGRLITIGDLNQTSAPMEITVTGQVGPDDVDIVTENFAPPTSATQDDRDGICYRLENLGFFTMETTRIAAVNPYGMRWKGEATFPDFNESPSPSPFPEDPPKVVGLRLGRGYKIPGAPIAFTQPFLHGYATKDQSIPGGGISFPVAIMPGTPFSVEWEIFIILA